MNLLGNIVWMVFGGFFAAMGYMIGGFLLCCTLVGIPFGVQCFKLAYLVLWPFGKQVVSRPSATGCLSPLFNIAWLIFGGLYIACVHLFFGVLLAITIIGLPFANQHFKLIPIALMPFGKDVIG
ncbi:MAG TPA: YccF domain-containing protein [Dinghuibacter sp.]|jgi:uncharacterized membrane protein YccF (DUF307 family)|uniref:YccF domain-containing protein n=1 Tax=Dinghuibacter sp. TaxID=2024697 RepID=UPI002C1E53E8|nr:YccF domain-containing protein [Dinghuibacter sp.]HTJ14783.1 YccF domain-containing protein [Dinghuibacter sp.]